MADATAVMARTGHSTDRAFVRWLIEEVGVASLKVGLDLPLLESQDPDFIRTTLHRMKDLMVYSHSISIAPKFTVGGAPCGWYEVEPGAEDDPCDWETFMAACQEIGYDGYYKSPSGGKSPGTNCRSNGISGIIETINYTKPNS